MNKILLLLSLFIFSTFFAFSQNINNSPHKGNIKYIYKIDDDYAKKLLSKNDKQIDEDYLTNLVDSMNIDSTFNKKLPVGYYLTQSVIDQSTKYELTYIPDYKVFIVNNYTDLLIKIYDKNGNIIPDAKLKVRGKRLKFDKKSQCYRIKKYEKDGILSINYQGNTSYFNLKDRFNYFRFKNLLSTLNIVWIPLKNTINNPRYYWFKSYYFASNLFDKFSFRQKYKSYMVLSQPKYRPGDTVKFKVYIAKSNGKPIDNEVDVFIQKNLYYSNNPKKLTTLAPIEENPALMFINLFLMTV